MIYATKLLLIKTEFFRDMNFLHLDALDDGTRQRLPVFRLRCACQQGKCIDEICDQRATRILIETTDGILGRHSLGRKKINFSQVFAGQAVGIKEVHDDIWLVSFMDYDLGYFDLETRVLEPLENPFGPKVLPMS